MTRIFGNFWMLKLLVHFLLIWHLEHVGFSSPSSTSSLVKCSRHWLSFTVPLLVGMGKLKSQKGSRVTETWSQDVHRREDRSWPTNTSTIVLSSLRRYRFQLSAAFWLSLKRKSLITRFQDFKTFDFGLAPFNYIRLYFKDFKNFQKFQEISKDFRTYHKISEVLQLFRLSELLHT